MPSTSDSDQPKLQSAAKRAMRWLSGRETPWYGSGAGAARARELGGALNVRDGGGAIEAEKQRENECQQHKPHRVEEALAVV